MILSEALREAMGTGYRVTVHAKFFPYESLDPKRPGQVHAVVDHGARAIYCSQQWFDELKKATV